MFQKKDFAAFLAANTSNTRLDATILLQMDEQGILFSADEPELCLSFDQSIKHKSKIIISEEIFEKILSNQVNPQEAANNQEIEFEGNRDLIYKFWINLKQYIER